MTKEATRIDFTDPEVQVDYAKWCQRLNQAQLWAEYSRHPERRALLSVEMARRDAGGGPPILGEGSGGSA